VKTRLLRDLLQQERSVREALVVQEATVVSELRCTQTGDAVTGDGSSALLDSTRTAQAHALADCGAGALTRAHTVCRGGREDWRWA